MNKVIKFYIRQTLLTVGFPWRLISICAKEQMSPTPTTSTVKFLKKSMISRDLFLRRKMRMKGVTIGLSNSSKMNTWFEQRKHCYTLSCTFWTSVKSRSMYPKIILINYQIVWALTSCYIKTPLSRSITTKTHPLFDSECDTCAYSLPSSPLCTGTAVPPHHGSHSCLHCPSSGLACSECAPACTAAAALDTKPYVHLGWRTCCRTH